MPHIMYSQHVNYGLCLIPIEEYIKPLLQSYKCMAFGHTTEFYKRNIVCSICSESHSWNAIMLTNICMLICKGAHIAVARICPVKIQKKNENRNKIMNKSTLGFFFLALNKSNAKANTSRPTSLHTQHLIKAMTRIYYLM